MLKNHYERLVVGEHYLGVWQALIEQNRKKSTLLIQDPHLRYAGSQTWLWSTLEIQSLKRSWKRLGLSDVEGVQSFFTKAPYLFVTKDWQLLLGQSVKLNLLEWWRKMGRENAPEWQALIETKEEVLDLWLFDAVERWIQAFVETSKNKKAFHYEWHAPEWLKSILVKIHKELSQELSKGFEAKHQMLFMMSSGLFEGSLRREVSHELLSFYLLKWLAPHYHLDEWTFRHQLELDYKRRGGDLKKTSIKQWQFFEDKFSSLLLNSFEGVIGSPEVYLVGSTPVDIYPYYHQDKRQFMKACQIDIPYDQKLPAPVMIFSESESLGTAKSFRALRLNQKLLSYYYLYPQLPGTKEHFYVQEAMTSLEKDLSRVGLSHLYDSNLKVTSAPERWSMTPPGSKSGARWTRSEFRDHESREVLFGIKDFGPFCGSFGSSLSQVLGLI